MPAVFSVDGANRLCVDVGAAQDKRWWRNFRTPTEVSLWIDGERRRASAVAVTAPERVSVVFELDGGGE